VNIYYHMQTVRRDHPETNWPTVMVRTLQHKLIYRRAATRRDSGDQCELYDMRADPRELHNLYDDPAYAGVRADLERRLLHWYLDTSNVPSWEQDPRVTPLIP
jgi:arylsulfatase A-like enzyme